MRSALLVAALDEVRDVGVEAASMRSIARRVGISHQGITHHFANRAALLTAIASQAWELLHERVASALAASTDDVPGGRVGTIGRAYVAFAREDRSRFGLMLASRVIESDDPELEAARSAVWQLHLETVRQEQDAHGWGGAVGSEELAFATFSLAHGLASLESEMPTMVAPGLGEDIITIVNRAIIGS